MSAGRKNKKLRWLLAEARDLLVHTDGHVPPCPGCDLEAQIDLTLGTQLDRRVLPAEAAE